MAVRIDAESSHVRFFRFFMVSKVCGSTRTNRRLGARNPEGLAPSPDSSEMATWCFVDCICYQPAFHRIHDRGEQQ
ncbi:unnamed protein product [Strongylus vulgaris]|uniref:Uncharacterized protein n=1 Tax=Strongylus vulgaris TaxID=40348 RepID=A0A3P7JQP6_STRVU|nr:unnamed protein product [Strongylus vulgaris]